MKRAIMEGIGFLGGYFWVRLACDGPEWAAFIAGIVIAMWVSLGMKRGA